MTDIPFGFGPPGDDRDRDRSGEGASGDLPDIGALFGGLSATGGIPDDLAAKMPLFAALQQMLTAQSGPVNWDLAKQMAISALAGGHRAPSPGERTQLVEAVRLADLWLDPATSLPSGVTAAEAWSRVEWVERTLPVWSALCDPVA
ncbi:MAG TPA: zinc-dependent metalloprotease, partial [Mycobacteriales bacterium]